MMRCFGARGRGVDEAARSWSSQCNQRKRPEGSWDVLLVGLQAFFPGAESTAESRKPGGLLRAISVSLVTVPVPLQEWPRRWLQGGGVIQRTLVSSLCNQTCA
jgi:hypothetical protein